MSRPPEGSGSLPIVHFSSMADSTASTGIPPWIRLAPQNSSCARLEELIRNSWDVAESSGESAHIVGVYLFEMHSGRSNWIGDAHSEIAGALGGPVDQLLIVCVPTDASTVADLQRNRSFLQQQLCNEVHSMPANAVQVFILNSWPFAVMWRLRSPEKIVDHTLQQFLHAHWNVLGIKERQFFRCAAGDMYARLVFVRFLITILVIIVPAATSSISRVCNPIQADWMLPGNAFCCA